MAKERWKRCPICQIYTDIDETHCPQSGIKKGHELKMVWLGRRDIRRLRRERKIMIKDIVGLQRKLARRKRPT